jgi:hypothetical protein
MRSTRQDYLSFRCAILSALSLPRGKLSPLLDYTRTPRQLELKLDGVKG